MTVERKQRINFWVTRAEQKKLAALADAAGTTMSDYLRTVVNAAHDKLQKNGKKTK